MKLMKNPNYLKPLFILLMLVLAHNVNSAEGISAKLNFHKKHSKRTFTRAHVKSKNDGNIQSISKNSGKSNTDMTFKALSKRSKFRKSSLISHSKSRSASENSVNSKDPVTITIFAITVAIKITQTILEHYTRKNLNPALTNLKAEREQNAHNVEFLQSNEIKTCSAMKLALTIAKHMYNITFFKMIYTDAYMEYLRLQSSRATCDIKIKKRKTKDCIMSQLVEKLKHLKENLTNVFPKMLDSMRDNVRGACEESDLSQELINRNKQIDSDIEKIQGKLDEEEASILGAILEGLLSDLEEQKGDLLEIEINSQLNDSIDPVKIPFYKKTYSMLIDRLNLGVDFYETVKKNNELKKKNDPSSIQWTQTIKSCLQFLGLIVNVVNKFLKNPTLRELEHIIYFVGSLIVLVGHIYAYRTEQNEKNKHELKKKLWEKVLDVVFAAGKCIASPVVSMIEESVHLYLKFQSYRESKEILQRSIRDRQIFDLKNERLYELSQKFQTYSQCQMRHFTMMQFFHIFKDVISIEENQLILDQNSQEAWKKIVIQGRSTLRIKGQIKSLCDRNIQFCSRTFSENYLKIEVGLTDTELEGMKREAVYGPYSDIAVAFSPDQADSYILLGYEPLYSKDSISQGMIMLGCRRCSKTHAIRYINLMKSHRHLENHKNLKLDNNLQTKIGKCPITDKICDKLFNDKKNNADGFCRSSEWKTIRVDYRTEESVLGYERVKFAGMTPVLSHLMFYEHGVGSSYVLNVTPKYAIWIDAEKTYYDCNTIDMHPDKNFKQQFLNLFCQECTSDLYAAPIIADTCLGTDSSYKPDNLETIYKINETSLSTQQQYYSDIKLNNIKLKAKIDSECSNSYIPNESEFIHKYILSGKQETIRVKFGFLFKFQEKNLKKYEHNWFLKYKQEIAQQKNPSFFSLANTVSKKIEITCEEYYPDSASRNTYREEDFMPCGSSLYYMLSFKPFNNQQGADSVSQSALTLQEIIKMKQSSTEICRKVCDKSQQDICQYDNPSRPTLKPKKSDKIETRLDGSFENGKNSNQISFSKNVIEWECINIDFGPDHLLILNDECGKAGSINRKYIEDEIVISIETKEKEEEENRKYYITSGFIEMQHPKRYEKFSIFSPVNKNKIEYWVRIYIKYDKNEGILPFNDFFYKLGLTSNKVCIETLIKSEFIERLWPRQFIEEENSKGKLFGNALTKIKNPFLDDTTIDLYSFLNKKYSCTYYNLFLPKMFNYNNKERQNLLFMDRLKKTYKKLVKEGDKYYERWSHSGPGLKDIYWIQIANKEEMFNDPKLVQIAWEHGYYPLETVVYEKTKELEDKTWMRVWISYQFKLDEDKEKLCRLCLENSK